MKPYRPAQRAGPPSANRIRERYLHQLGLQRGSQPHGPMAAPKHQVVVIGLPSLPEERETHVPTNLKLESHDFSNYQNRGDASQHTADSEMCDSKALSGDGESDSGSSHKRSRAHSPSLSMGIELDVPITSLALSYPTALLKPPPEAAVATQNKANGNRIAQWFSKGIGQADSKPQQITDQDSVTSTATSTTAGSSFSAMVSNDWSATQSVEPLRVESSAPASAGIQGVHFRSNPRVWSNTAPQCVTSSLAHALNRFNIDSDCEASIASQSFAGGASIMTEEEDHAMDEDDTSVHSNASFVSMGSHRSNLSSTPRPRARKAGKARRLLDRAAAHERILQTRNEQSQKIRANLVHTQRMGHQDTPETRSRSNSNASSHSSVPLLHVQHGNANHAPVSSVGPPPQHFTHGGDLSRTPTVSNCSDLRKLRAQVPMGLAHPALNYSPAAGVHVSSKESNVSVQSNHSAVDSIPGTPLQFHPHLASAAPPPQVADMRSAEAPISSSTISAHESLAHRRQTSMEDVLEVVEALSKLKGKGKGAMIPRVR